MKNQREMILQYIRDYGSITSFEAYIDLGVTQLATRIKELKEQGYQFNTEWIPHKTRYGRNKPYKKYMLMEVTDENRNSIAM